MLQVSDLHTNYGYIQALRGINLEVRAGEIVTLIGANGAGKSTLLKTLAGLLAPRRGRVLLQGQAIAGRPAYEVAKFGLALVPEGRRIFPRLTVRETLELGGWLCSAAERRERVERAMELFPVLRKRANQLGGSMSGGEQQMLAIARAMMSRPKLLLLDEPSMGLSPKLVGEVFEFIRRIHAAGTTILLVEQNAHMALAVAQRGYVLETGAITLEAPCAELRTLPQVREAYLGEV